MTRTVEVYRLWPNGTWDKKEVTVGIFEGINDDALEARACEDAWLELARTGGPQPIQIGMLMASLYAK